MRSAATPDSVDRVVLVGDRVPNDAPPVLALADPAKGEHTPVTALRAVHGEAMKEMQGN